MIWTYDKDFDKKSIKPSVVFRGWNDKTSVLEKQANYYDTKNENSHLVTYLSFNHDIIIVPWLWKDFRIL